MKPILFNTEMVCAILDGLKTVTRRPIKPHYRPDEAGFQIITDAHTGAYVRIEYYDGWENETRIMTDPYQCGDILYVRETFCQDNAGKYYYKADDSIVFFEQDIGHGLGWQFLKWRPSIHMPREAARIFLRVTDVRAERLQDIAYADIIREGITEEDIDEREAINREASSKDLYSRLWNSTVKPAALPLYGWDANPWVWVIAFERISKEEAYAHNAF